jgi:hypothetical protein
MKIGKPKVSWGYKALVNILPDQALMSAPIAVVTADWLLANDEILRRNVERIFEIHASHRPNDAARRHRVQLPVEGNMLTECLKEYERDVLHLRYALRLNAPQCTIVEHLLLGKPLPEQQLLSDAVRSAVDARQDVSVYARLFLVSAFSAAEKRMKLRGADVCEFDNANKGYEEIAYSLETPDILKRAIRFGFGSPPKPVVGILPIPK